MNVIVGELMGEELRKQSIPREQTQVIANWQDGMLVRPVTHDKNPLRGAWGLKDKFVVAYSGNLGRVHELATVLDAIALLQGQAVTGRGGGAAGDEVRFLFIGGGALRRALQDEVAARGLNNVALRPYEPRSELSHSLSVADVHLVTLRPEFEGLVVPSKFYGIAAAGRPTLFVGDPSGEIARLIALHECGVSVRCGDGAALAAAIEALSQDPARCEAMGWRARAMLEAYFDKRIAIAQWVEALEVPPGKPIPDRAFAGRASRR